MWLKENGESREIKNVVEPFIVLDENRRMKPIEQNVKVHNVQKQLFHGLSERMRGKAGADPFELRNNLITLD